MIQTRICPATGLPFQPRFYRDGNRVDVFCRHCKDWRPADHGAFNRQLSTALERADLAVETEADPGRRGAFAELRRQLLRFVPGYRADQTARKDRAA